MNRYKKSCKSILAVGLLGLFLIACAPKRTQTQFSKNKEAEAGQEYTEDQLRAALGAARYDELAAGIGAYNVGQLAYGIGISNMSQLLENVNGPGKMVALMSNGANSTKLTAVEVLDFLNKLDDACYLSTNFLVYGTDTIKKMANMVNGVTVAGMEGIKNILHGVAIQPSDAFGAPYSTNAISRLGLLVAMLNENAAPSIMAQLINNIAAPSGTFSASGTAKLIRMVNETQDLWNLFVIIDQTGSVANITDVMVGLSGNMFCTKPWYLNKTTCDAATGGLGWTNLNCYDLARVTNYPQYNTKATCDAALGVGAWISDGIENMTQTINQLNKVCSTGAYLNAKDCRTNSATWYTMAGKIPVIVNNITNVTNMYTIVNGLTNDGVAYVSGTPDGVDTMVATINNIYNAAMGDTGAYAIYGLNGVKRLAYMVNQLDPSPLYGNNSDFENGGSCSNPIYETAAACTGGGGTWTANPAYNCATGNFDNRLNWAFTDEGSVAAPFNGKAFGTTNAFAQGGSCSLTNDNTAATQSTITQSAEQVFNITTAGAATFYTKTDTLQNGDVLRYFIDDVLQATYTNASGAGFQLRTTAALAVGMHRLRFDVQRLFGSTGKVYLDTVTLPATKGAGRTAAEKTYIMMNNLYLASSINNVATMINTVTIPSAGGACWNTPPVSCTPTNTNGMDTLIYIVNRSEYPLALATVPRLATTVNTISNLNEMVSILNNVTGATLTAQNQLVSMMDHVQTPANIPDLVNRLGAGGGAKTATIIQNLTASGTNSMLRALADFIIGGPVGSGATVQDLSTMINGTNTTSHIGVILSELSLSGNIFLGKTLTVPISNASPGLVTWASHGYTEGSPIQFSTTGGLPAPLQSGVTYYIKNVAAGSFNLSATRYGAAINTTTAGSGTHTGYASGEIYYASPVGGVKLAQFMNQVNKMSVQYAQVCNPSATSTASQFCLKNHMIRLLNDIAASAAGPAQIAEIVGSMRPDVGPSAQGASAAPGATCTAPGCTGVERMVNVMYDVRVMDAGTCIINGTINIGYSNATKCTLANTPGYCSVGSYPDSASCAVGLGTWTAATTVVWTPPAANAQYTNPLLNTNTDKAGRLTAMIGDMGSNGGTNTARMVNEVEAIYETSLDSGAPRVSYLLNNTNRMRYLSRMLSEMTSADLFVQLLNNSGLQISKISTLVNLEGDGTYGVATIGSYGGAIYGTTPSGYQCTATDCDINTTDQLGRTIQMVNNITQIPNTVSLLVGAQDITYITYLINNATRIHYMTDIVNRLTNVDLLVKILNGADACSVYATGVNDTVATDTSPNCTTAGGSWYGVGKCKTNPALTTVAACGAANWEGADRPKLMGLVNAMGNSELKGNVDAGDLVGAGMNTKAVGDEFVLADTVNQLGYSGVTPRSLGQQMRVVRVINAVQYCGLKPQYDKRIQNGAACVDGSNVIQAGYQFEEACTAAGLFWRAKYNSTNVGNCTANGGTGAVDGTGYGCWVPAATIYNTCNDASYQKPSTSAPASGIYYNNGDRFDGRNRTAALMLGVTNGDAFSVVVGDVQDTSKTINMVNGVRRVRTLSQFVKWLPGTVTAALVNNTQPPAILRSLVYLANNLEENEDDTARAFASMVHFGIKMVAQPGGRSMAGGPAGNCMEFTGLGPRRLAAVMNLEAGPYLEGLVGNLGWQISIPAMNCGWAKDAGQDTGSCSAEDGRTGGMFKAVGRSYVGNPKPTGNQCVRPRELTAGYRYGDHAWGTNQGVRSPNCVRFMPEASGLPGLSCTKVTDEIIDSGFSTILGSIGSGIADEGCDGSSGCLDMWAILKGQGTGFVGSMMNDTGSAIGFPPPRVYSDSENSTTGLKGGTTTRCTQGSNDGNNWQCIRDGLNGGDMRPGDTGNGYYWGTYCAAGNSLTPGSISGAAGSTALSQSCVGNGGTWKTERNYQGPSCNLDPSILGPATPKMGP